jgi:aminopeptidase N
MREDHWRMDQPIQVYAIMFAVGRFEVAKDSWTDSRGQTHEVSYYTEPAYAPYARGMFRNTPGMMDFFSRATGVDYPWGKYSQIVVRDYVSGAMENTTASLFGEWMNQNSRQLLDAGTEDVVSHELFHQWFGDYVTAESWSHLTLSESFATYGSQLWRRHKYGAASAQELA